MLIVRIIRPRKVLTTSTLFSYCRDASSISTISSSASTAAMYKYILQHLPWGAQADRFCLAADRPQQYRQHLLKRPRTSLSHQHTMC